MCQASLRTGLRRGRVIVSFGSTVTLGCDEVWHHCPLQLDVVKDDITGKATISSTRKGWDKTHINWFDKTIEPKKMKNKPPPVYAQKFVNLREAQESIYINKTLSTVRLEYDNNVGRVYDVL